LKSGLGYPEVSDLSPRLALKEEVALLGLKKPREPFVEAAIPRRAASPIFLLSMP
jgi:hypothetical protein